MSTEPTTQNDSDAGKDNAVLTVDEAAGILRISRGLAFAAVRTGTIPHIRIGRRILVPRAQLLLMLKGASAQPPF